MTSIVPALASAFVQLACATPALFIGLRPGPPPRRAALLGASLLFLVTAAATDALGGLVLFPGQRWNWAGKGAAFLIALAFVLAHRPSEMASAASNFKPDFSNARPLLGLTLAYVAVRVALYLANTSNPLRFDLETTLFQATLPGLAEEFVFRGGIMAFMNAYFGSRPWQFSKTSFGGGAVSSALLFGLTHALWFDPTYSLHTALVAGVRTAFDGFLFALLVEQTKSLWPSIILHNALNLIGNH